MNKLIDMTLNGSLLMLAVISVGYTIQILESIALYIK